MKKVNQKLWGGFLKYEDWYFGRSKVDALCGKNFRVFYIGLFYIVYEYVDAETYVP